MTDDFVYRGMSNFLLDIWKEDGIEKGTKFTSCLEEAIKLGEQYHSPPLVLVKIPYDDLLFGNPYCIGKTDTMGDWYQTQYNIKFNQLDIEIIPIA